MIVVEPRPPGILADISQAQEYETMDQIVFPGLSDQLTLAEQISIIAKRRGMKLTELAEAAGVRPSTVWAILGGKVNKPRVKSLEGIINALGYDVVIHLGPDGPKVNGYSDPRLREILRARRLERTWNQDVVALIAGVSEKMIQRFESGTQFPKEENILKIANALYDNRVRITLEPKSDPPQRS